MVKYIGLELLDKVTYGILRYNSRTQTADKLVDAVVYFGIDVIRSA